MLTPQISSAFFKNDSGLIAQEIEQTKLELDALPEISLNFSPWTLGYRSGIIDEPDTKIEILVEFDQSAPVDLIALMPATYTDNGQELKVYCFPKRFMIERIAPDGSSEVVVDHRNQDYIIEGVEPQLFELPQAVKTSALRLTVTEASRNETWAYGAYRVCLSELYAFSGDQNVALNQKVSASSISAYSYVWSEAALVDGFSLFSPIARAPQNPNVVPLRIQDIEQVELTFDLGEVKWIDEYHLWPLVHGLQFNHPPSSGLGFPLGLKIELANEPDFSDSSVILSEEAIYPVPGSNPLLLHLGGSEARYVRISLDNIVRDFRTGISELALDEIELLGRGRTLSTGLVPEINSVEVSEKRLAALTDGRTAEGTILPQRKWLFDFARRAQLERSLGRLTEALESAQRVEKERATYAVTLAVGLIVILALMICLVYLFSERKWIRIRERIACDIHDDLGANLISVAHSVELIEHSIENATEAQSRLLKSAKLTAHQTAEDTRQIVRLLERQKGGVTWTDSLRATVKNLLGDIDYTLRFEEKREFNQLDTTRSWDLLLFIKEAVNNIVKHANAEHVEISLRRAGKKLQVEIIDDGIGMPKDQPHARHLAIRAERLGGKLHITTNSGAGTHIRLEL